MPLTTNHPLLKEQTVQCHSASVGTTPVAAVTRVPFRGKAVKCGVVVGGAFTVDMSVAVAINGVAVTGSPFTVTAAGSGVGTIASFIPSGANAVNEDDVISFTPSGSTGTAVPGTFFAVIQAA